MYICVCVCVCKFLYPCIHIYFQGCDSLSLSLSPQLENEVFCVCENVCACEFVGEA